MARVEVQGGRVPEIEATANPRLLAGCKLSLHDIEQALSQANVVRAVGLIDRRYQQYQTPVSGEATTPEQIAVIVVAQRGGIPITLKMVAAVAPSAEDQTTIVTANEREAVLPNIVRQPEANTVTVANGVRKELDRLMCSLPKGTSIKAYYDQSTLINEAICSVRDAVLIGAGLAAVVLPLFLGNLRATIVTAAIIPATVLITFLLMRLAGLTLNLTTLGALAVGIGLVIDDAIVVVENVFRHLSRGEERANAVKLAAGEITAPMSSSTLTTVVVFLPLVLVTGVVGAFFTALALTMAIAPMVSLALALPVSPSLCAVFLSVRHGAKEHGRLFDRTIRAYSALLKFSLRHRWTTPVAALAIVLVTVFLALRLRTGLMPEMDEGRKKRWKREYIESAVVRAGEVRLRPILMTTLTAILGLALLAFGLGEGAEMQKPLAIAVICGLTFSTMFTLVFAPVLRVSFIKMCAKLGTVANGETAQIVVGLRVWVPAFAGMTSFKVSTWVSAKTGGAIPEAAVRPPQGLLGLAVNWAVSGAGSVVRALGIQRAES